eukprot:Hpha_TRINITY_DN15821_c4_g1::TRINITY_DN15821_c4_g1_i4::g.188667::m.188667
MECAWVRAVAAGRRGRGLARWYSDAVHGRAELVVPFDRKEEAKQLGARFDAERRVWYCDAGEDVLLRTFCQYAEVPYGREAEARALGLEHDARRGLWYGRSHDVRNAMARWRTDMHGHGCTELVGLLRSVGMERHLARVQPSFPTSSALSRATEGELTVLGVLAPDNRRLIDAASRWAAEQGALSSPPAPRDHRFDSDGRQPWGYSSPQHHSHAHRSSSMRQQTGVATQHAGTERHFSKQEYGHSHQGYQGYGRRDQHGQTPQYRDSQAQSGRNTPSTRQYPTTQTRGASPPSAPARFQQPQHQQQPRHQSHDSRQKQHSHHSERLHGQPPAVRGPPPPRHFGNPGPPPRQVATGPGMAGPGTVLLSYPLERPMRALHAAVVPLPAKEKREEQREAFRALHHSDVISVFFKSREFGPALLVCSSTGCLHEILPEAAVPLLDIAPKQQVLNPDMDHWMLRAVLSHGLWRHCEQIKRACPLLELQGIGQVETFRDGQSVFFQAVNGVRVPVTHGPSLMAQRRVKLQVLWGDNNEPLARRIDVHCGSLFTSEEPLPSGRDLRGTEVTATGGAHFSGEIVGEGPPVGEPLEWLKGRSLLEYNRERYAARVPLLAHSRSTEPSVRVRSIAEGRTLDFPSSY